MGSPKVLNLDEIETTETEIAIRHNGVDHKMKVLDVDTFIAQQKRQRDYEKQIADGDIEAPGEELVDVVEVIRNSVTEFFPTLPVGELETPKLFKIFQWLNEMTAKINDIASGEVIEETEGEVGNEQSEEQTAN